MTIIQKDIERYTSYMEFAQDELFRCHPNSEKRLQNIIMQYCKVIKELELLAEALKIN